MDEVRKQAQFNAAMERYTSDPPTGFSAIAFQLPTSPCSSTLSAGSCLLLSALPGSWLPLLRPGC